MKIHSVFLAAVLSALVAPATAQVHRCTDADGKVSFSDTVCTGQHAQKTFGNHASSRSWTVSEPARSPKVVVAAPVAPAAVLAEKPAAVASR